MCVRWYTKFSLSYRNLVEMMSERGIGISHTTIMRWTHQYAPEIEKKVRKYLKPTNDSWRVDETYCKIKGQWKHLYRAVDSEGNTIDFLLSEHRDKNAAENFFKKALTYENNQCPRIITVDKNPSYLRVIDQLIYDQVLPFRTQYRQVKYLNNIIEQDHRFIKRIICPMLGFKSFDTAEKTIKEIETMHIIKKGQVGGLNRGALSVVEFINKLFGFTA